MPNPTATALIRAGDLTDRTTYFRNDLAFAANPATPKDPHVFLLRIFNPAVAAFALGAQQQIGIFFATGRHRCRRPGAVLRGFGMTPLRGPR